MLQLERACSAAESGVHACVRRRVYLRICDPPLSPFAQDATGFDDLGLAIDSFERPGAYAPGDGNRSDVRPPQRMAYGSTFDAERRFTAEQ